MTAQETNLSNFFETTLNGILASGATSGAITAAPTSDGTSAIAAPYYLVIDPDNASTREVVLVTAASGTTLSTITRDVEGRHSTDPTHVDGTVVRMSVIKEMFQDAHDRIDALPTNDSTDTLTNKSIDSDNNTITNIVNADIKAAAAIDATKIADGTVTSAEFQHINTLSSNAQTQLDSKLPLAGGTMTGAINAGDQEVSAVLLKDYAETDVAVTSATTLAIDLANGNTGSVTLAHNVTDIDFTNVPANGTSSFTLKVTQDGTGSRTLAINKVTVNGGSEAVALTAGNAGITLTTAANSVDLVTFLFFDAGNPLVNALLDFKNS